MSQRKKTWVFVISTVVVIGGITFLKTRGQLPRLTGTLQPSEKRSEMLTALAAQEAALITDVDARLTRLLNLAELQIQRQWLEGGRATLEAGRRTLGSDDAKKLNDHARISGWVSISELSRHAKDNRGASSACDGAVIATRAIEDPARRCDYVMGVCNELQYLKGKSAAAELLAEVGPWSKSIDDVRLRRLAVVSFAAALFNLDDFSRGQQMLRQEDDASWRSDTLTRLASASNDPPARFASHRAAVLVSPALPEAPPAEGQYGKQLGYRDVFQGQKNSQTKKD
jgi:hypothetical protein